MVKVISLDIYASAGIGVLALLFGLFFTRKVPFLKRYCIPAPVSGGLLVSLATLLLFSASGIECRFDGTVKDLCMMLFFTSVGFQSDLKVLKKGGRPLLAMIGLQLFLGMAMSSLRLWELASLALPLTLILIAQVAFMALYGAFVAFPLLGRNYDSAVLVSGLCGFGLGATPNAMANMSAVCYKYRYAVNPFIIVPIIGAMFVDLINTGVVTLFLNLVR